MDTDIIKSITFGSICSLLKRKYNIPQNKIAEELYYDNQTVSRWINERTAYKSLRKEQYNSLFNLIKKTCEENDVEFVELFVGEFTELKNYKNESDIKRIIINSLNYHIDEFYKDANKVPKNTSASGSTRFISKCLDNGQKIKRVDIAAHSAAQWLKEKSKNKLLDELVNQGVDIRVLLNDQKSIGDIAKSMADPQNRKWYLGFDACVDQWAQLALDGNFSKKLSFRISTYPLFRRIFIVTYEDNRIEALVRNYAYAFHPQDSSGNQHITGNDFYLDVYKNEFEYLWENAQSYDEWNSNKSSF